MFKYFTCFSIIAICLLINACNNSDIGSKLQKGDQYEYTIQIQQISKDKNNNVTSKNNIFSFIHYSVISVSNKEVHFSLKVKLLDVKAFSGEGSSFSSFNYYDRRNILERLNSEIIMIVDMESGVVYSATKKAEDSINELSYCSNGPSLIEIIKAQLSILAMDVPISKSKGEKILVDHFNDFEQTEIIVDDINDKSIQLTFNGYNSLNGIVDKVFSRAVVELDTKQLKEMSVILQLNDYQMGVPVVTESLASIIKGQADFSQNLDNQIYDHQDPALMAELPNLKDESRKQITTVKNVDEFVLNNQNMLKQDEVFPTGKGAFYISDGNLILDYINKTHKGFFKFKDMRLLDSKQSHIKLDLFAKTDYDYVPLIFGESYNILSSIAQIKVKAGYYPISTNIVQITLDPHKAVRVTDRNTWIEFTPSKEPNTYIITRFIRKHERVNLWTMEGIGEGAKLTLYKEKNPIAPWVNPVFMASALNVSIDDGKVRQYKLVLKDTPTKPIKFSIEHVAETPSYEQELTFLPLEEYKSHTSLPPLSNY